MPCFGPADRHDADRLSASVSRVVWPSCGSPPDFLRPQPTDRPPQSSRKIGLREAGRLAEPLRFADANHLPFQGRQSILNANWYYPSFDVLIIAQPPSFGPGPAKRLGEVDTQKETLYTNFESLQQRRTGFGFGARVRAGVRVVPHRCYGKSGEIPGRARHCKSDEAAVPLSVSGRGSRG